METVILAALSITSIIPDFLEILEAKQMVFQSFLSANHKTKFQDQVSGTEIFTKQFSNIWAFVETLSSLVKST